MKKRLFSLFTSILMVISLISVLPTMTASAEIIKSENELKTILQNKISKNIVEWKYADYDGDGTKEAFAIVGKDTYNYNNPDKNPSVNVWFINSKGEATQIKHNVFNGEKIIYSSYSFCSYYSDVKIFKQDKKCFLSFLTGMQAPSIGFLFGVENGKAYEYNVSGRYQNFTLENNQFYASDIGVNSNGIVWFKRTMAYDSKTHEFIISNEKTIPNVKGIKISAISANAVKLTWNKVKTATGYTIYQINNGKWSKIKSLTGTSYTISKLKAGTSYKFAVKAYKKIGKGLITSPNYPETGIGPSYKIITTSTNPAKVNFKLSAGSKKATVKWSKVTGATGYKVYYKTSKNGKWVGLKSTNNKTTSYTKTELKKGKTYWFTVKAYRKVSGKTYNAAYATKSVKVK